MRQGQHNKNRSRGRGNQQQQQRRPGNSTNRVYESNGPDVKVRGTAQTVADKYLQLARDAVSSGDIVMSESYYQHAEHYMRIIAANQGYNQQQQQQRMQEAAAADDTSPAEEVPGSGPQPVAVDQAKDAEPVTGGADENVDRESSTANGPQDKDTASFDGDLPQFLKTPTDEAAPAEKPKRTRRAPSRSKPAKKDSDGDAEPATAAETPAEPDSDTEAAVG